MADIQYAVMRTFVPGSPMAEIYPEGMILVDEAYAEDERDYALADLQYYEQNKGDHVQAHVVVRREITIVATPWVEDKPEEGTFED